MRRLPAFSRFLTTAALTNGQMLNFAKIGNDAGLPAATVREHYFLLEDTLVGFLLPVWVKSKKRLGDSDLRGLAALAEEKIVDQLLLVSEDPIEAKRGPIRCLPWRKFVEELWSDKLF